MIVMGSMGVDACSEVVGLGGAEAVAETIEAEAEASVE